MTNANQDDSLEVLNTNWNDSLEVINTNCDDSLKVVNANCDDSLEVVSANCTVTDGAHSGLVRQLQEFPYGHCQCIQNALEQMLSNKYTFSLL